MKRVFTAFLAVSFAFGTYGPSVLGCGGGAKSAENSLSSPQKGVIYYHTDHLGNSHLITDSQGNILREEVRYPYGLDRLIEETQATTADYVYTGKEHDEETGLIYFGARYYSPEMGRWISPDPLFLEDKPDTVLKHPFSSNIYAYVRNNPVMYVDLKGDIENYVWRENRKAFGEQYRENIKSENLITYIGSRNLLEVFEGSQVGVGTGIRSKVKIGFLKFELGMDFITGYKLTSSSIEQFARDKAGGKLKFGPIRFAIEKVNGNMNIDRSYKQNWFSITEFGKIEYGATIPFTPSGQAVNFEIHINIDALWEENNEILP